MKKIIAFSLFVLFFMLGCSQPANAERSNKSASMFTEVESSTFESWKIVYHNETKVMYAISTGSRNGGNFTVLVNPDGTPMLWETNG